MIVGGGIGGLTAALCLDKFGWDVAVLERAPVLDEIGAGIQISPNGMRVFQALGLRAAVEALGFRPRASQFRMGVSGRVILTSSMRDYEDRYGAPYIHIHRADLIAILQKAVAARMPNGLRTGMTVTGYGQTKAKAWAMVDDGSTSEADILIGADGLHSVIRSQMLGPDSPRFTGNIAWRATVPVEALGRNAPLPVAGVWFGEGKHAVTYLVRGGSLANFVGVVERGDGIDKRRTGDKAAGESWTGMGSRKEALADFAGWHPAVTSLVEAADSLYRWALYDRKPLDQWADGRVVLLGDACHPMLPFMAQGAVQAIEDGFVLARSLAPFASEDGAAEKARAENASSEHASTENNNIDAALQRYFETRHRRTAKVQLAAQDNMHLFHQRAGEGRLGTYGALWAANKLKPGLLEAQVDWLYGHDVTA